MMLILINLAKTISFPAEKKGKIHVPLLVALRLTVDLTGFTRLILYAFNILYVPTTDLNRSSEE